MARGDEMLIVDGNTSDREGMKKLFEEEGYVVATAADTQLARELLHAKFYPAVVLDIDIGPDPVLDVLRQIHAESPQTGVIFLTNRKPFDVTLEAFRRGVVDVVLKKPDQIPYLRGRVAVAAERYRVESSGKSELVREARDVLDEALRRLMEMARKVPATASVLTEITDLTTTVLLVEDDATVTEAVREALGAGFDLVPVNSGGAGLDQATMHKRYDVVAAKDALPDLPGSLVVKTLQQHNPDVAAVVYEGPGMGGRLDVYDHGKRLERAPFVRMDELIELVRALADRAQSTRRERRFLQAFRSQESAFLRRFAQLKKKIDGI